VSVRGRGKVEGESRDERRREGEGYTKEVVIEHRHIRGTGTERTGRVTSRVGYID
jgi:hypothetical protein